MLTVQERLTAIAEPTRFRIVELLRHGPQPVGTVVTHLGVGQPQISRHLRVLTEAGVVTSTKHGQRRIYALDAEPWRVLQVWIESFSTVWTDRLDRFDSCLTDSDRSPA